MYKNYRTLTDTFEGLLNLHYKLLSISFLLVFALFSNLFAESDTIPTDSVKSISKRQTVVVIPVDGDVDPGMAAFISKSIDDAKQYSDPFFVIEMNTFGGRVDAALQIVDTLSTIPMGKSVAYVKNKAISAGALIAFSCNKLAMKANTTIGDCAPISFTNDGPTMLGEKFQSPLRAKFRSLAKKNGYPENLAESMVTAELIIKEVKFPDSTLYLDSLEYAEMSKEEKRRIVSERTVVKRGELLTMDNEEAENLGFSSFTSGTIADLLEKLDIKNYDLIRIEESWSVDFVRFIGKISGILIMLGLAALYTEVKSPGFGIPGLVGIVCLGLVFGSQYMIGMADYTELIILFVGMMLLAAEVFVIPGFGIAGILGILFISVGLMLSFQDFVIPKPELPWQKDIMGRNIQMLAISLSGAIVLIIMFFKYVYPKISAIIPGPNLMEDLASAHIDSGLSLDVKLGDVGTVSKVLRPSGEVIIDDKTYDAIADGEFIDKNTTVEVVEIHGNSLLVKRSDTDGQ